MNMSQCGNDDDDDDDIKDNVQGSSLGYERETRGNRLSIWKEHDSQRSACRQRGRGDGSNENTPMHPLPSQN